MEAAMSMANGCRIHVKGRKAKAIQEKSRKLFKYLSALLRVENRYKE
jgi:hypothetical protein